MPFFMKTNMQESSNLMSTNNSMMMDQMNMIMMLLIVIILFIMKSKNKTKKNTSENKSMEMMWTIIPSFIVLLLSLPAIMCVYLMEENKKNNYIMKITGNQWYWSYNYSNKMMKSHFLLSSLKNRCLVTDQTLFLKASKKNQMIFSSTDVIHSWTLPSSSIKMDCIPGRLNSMSLNMMKSMKMKGQCSEICGMNHSFMPISLLVLSFIKFNFLN